MPITDSIIIETMYGEEKKWFPLTEGPLSKYLRHRSNTTESLHAYLKHLAKYKCEVDYMHQGEWDEDSIFMKMRLNCNPSSSVFARASSRTSPNLKYDGLNEVAVHSKTHRSAAALEAMIDKDSIYVQTFGKDDAALPFTGLGAAQWKVGKTLMCVFTLTMASMMESQGANLNEVTFELAADSRDNNPRLVKYYESMGFKLTGIHHSVLGKPEMLATLQDALEICRNKTKRRIFPTGKRGGKHSAQDEPKPEEEEAPGNLTPEAEPTPEEAPAAISIPAVNQISCASSTSSKSCKQAGAECAWSKLKGNLKADCHMRKGGRRAAAAPRAPTPSRRCEDFRGRKDCVADVDCLWSKRAGDSERVCHERRLRANAPRPAARPRSAPRSRPASVAVSVPFLPVGGEPGPLTKMLMKHREQQRLAAARAVPRQYEATVSSTNHRPSPSLDTGTESDPASSSLSLAERPSVSRMKERPTARKTTARGQDARLMPWADGQDLEAFQKKSAAERKVSGSSLNPWRNKFPKKKMANSATHPLARSSQERNLELRGKSASLAPWQKKASWLMGA